MPRVLHKVNPEYTPEALRAKLEGTVLLQAVVRTHGVPSDISVLRSLDRRFGLDQQAVAALRQWRFAPGQRAGQPVPVLVQVEMNFSLK
jgi:TonB family protein